jgi:hypothetical protein
MDVDTGSCKHLENQTIAWELKHGFRENTFMKNRVERLEAVISLRFSRSYKRQCISRFRFRLSRDQSEIRDSDRSQEILHRDLSDRHYLEVGFNMWAVVIDCNCKEVPVNPNHQIQNPLLLVTPTPLYVTIGFEVPISVVMKMFIFWAIISCIESRPAFWSNSRACYQLHAGFFLSLFFDLKDGGDMFFRNVGWLSAGYVTLYPKK